MAAQACYKANVFDSLPYIYICILCEYVGSFKRVLRNYNYNIRELYRVTAVAKSESLIASVSTEPTERAVL